MRRIFVAGIASLMLFAVPALTAQESLPTEIVVQQPNLQPEGIEWDAAGQRFLLGSLTQGSITSVTLDGTSETLIEDPDLMATVGIEVDATNNRLLVTNSDPSAFGGGAGGAALAAYDLEDGDRLFYVDLAPLYDGTHFANDVAVDAEGYAYVTDSFSPVIYRVDQTGEAEVFFEDDSFASQGFGLNGIAYHPDGYLLVANTGTGSLFKVPLDAPENITEVETDQPVAIDGMFLDSSGDLFIINNAEDQQTVQALSSEDDWVTAAVVANAATGGNATTVTVIESEDAVLPAAFYINAYLNDPSIQEYEITQAVWEAVG